MTQALRQVVGTTLTQLESVPGESQGKISQTHVAALQGIVTSGHAQMETARELRRIIQRTLTEIRGTPLEHVSAHLLTSLSEAVQRQAADLEAIIGEAIGEANTPEQLRKLRRVGVEAASRLLEAEHGRAERELAQLNHLGTEALERIRDLEQDGQSHAEQKAQLEQEAKTSRQSISVLEAADLHDRAEIAQLEQQEEESQGRIEELKAAAVDSRERLVKLQRQLIDQTDREDELNRDGVPDTGAENESQP